MDETKSAVAKLVDKFTDVVGNVAAAASSAAQHAMESNARRMEPDAAWIAASAGEQIYIPETNDAAAIPAPLIAAAPKKRPTPGKSSGTEMAAPKKAKKAAKKAAAPNLAGKSSKRGKKIKPSTGRKAVASKKNASKAAKKKKAKRA